MRKDIFLFLSTMCVSLLLCALSCYGQEQESEVGRYSPYKTDTVLILLDTKTGKLRKVSSEMSGKPRAEGITVEGLTYSSADQDTLNLKVKEINLEEVSENKRSKCRNEILSEFSYRLDSEKIRKILKNYLKE